MSPSATPAPTTVAPVPTSARRRRSWSAAALLGAPLLALAACGDGGGAASGAASGSSSAAPSTPAAEPTSDVTEVATATPRLVVTLEGGDLAVLDATTLEPVADVELDGYLRINDAGDGRHVLVSTTGGFRVMDAGTWGEPHGDHSHYYTSDPVLTDVVHPAETPAHVVTHAGRTALFDDGTGGAVVVDSTDVAEADPQARTVESGAAHHGVAVEMADGRLVHTVGTEEERSTVVLLDAEGTELARTDECPGMHGEATAADETAVVGCEDGIVVVRGDTLTKIAAPDAYGRIGNQAGSEESPVVLGDYKRDEGRDSATEGPERTQTVSLTDTAAGTLTLVDLPASYTFRSLGRGEDGEALVLGTDGALHVIDPVGASISRSVPVVEAWEEPDDWQEPRPALRVHEGTAYVTEPATREVHAVDVVTGEVFATASLDGVPDEVVVVSGATPAVPGGQGAAEGGEHAEGDHDHAEGEHDHAEGEAHEHEHGDAVAGRR